jgi:hypothetical protein
MIARRVAAALILTAALAAGARAQEQAFGTWELTTLSPEGEFTSTVEIRKEGTAMVMVGKGQNGERKFDSIAVEGDKIAFSYTIQYNGSPMVLGYRGEIKGSTMDGGVDFGGLASGSFSAVKK